MNRLPEVKAFLRRPGGIDQYPSVELEWILHRSPTLRAQNAAGHNVTMDLSGFDTDGLHNLFSAHFHRLDVEPPSLMVRTWRRLFGWAYGISAHEAVIYHTLGALVLLCVLYLLCFRYTSMCDTIQDL